MTSDPRPTPSVDADSAPYWQGAAVGELRLPKCRKCHLFIFYPRSVCPTCMSRDLVWERATGEATVYSYAIVHKAPPGFTHDVPYAVALVDLAEDVRMMTRIVDCRTDQVHVGMQVRVVFHEYSGDLTLPCFAPVHR
jgi:uncharacterized protein